MRSSPGNERDENETERFLATRNCTVGVKQVARVFSSRQLFLRLRRCIATAISLQYALTRFSRRRTLAVQPAAPRPAAEGIAPVLPRTVMHRRKLVFALIAIGACAPPAVRGPAEAIHPSNGSTRILGASTPGAFSQLSAADAQWVDATVASLSLREKVAQLIMPWVPGEYAAVGSPGYEELRKWVEEDRIGGLVISIGLP